MQQDHEALPPDDRTPKKLPDDLKTLSAARQRQSQLIT